jgi:hypothetical protein
MQRLYHKKPILGNKINKKRQNKIQISTRYSHYQVRDTSILDMRAAKRRYPRSGDTRATLWRGRERDSSGTTVGHGVKRNARR